MDFLNFGYYIVEPSPIPEYLNLTCKQVLTVSECLCTIHPSLTGFLFHIELVEQPLEYKKSLMLSDKEFTELQEMVLHLYNERKLDVDSRFIRFSDALLFCKKYLYNKPNAKVISIALESAYKDAFIEEVDRCLNATLLEHRKSDGDFLGYDILGWDFSYFHTYLCNGLNQDISSKYLLDVNKYGLLQNPYSQVKIFSEYIDGKGEPVMWFPFAVYEHQLIGNDSLA